MLTYPVSFLNAGGAYEEAIGRRYLHNSVMDKYTSRIERTLEVRQAENYVEFMVRYSDVDSRSTRDDVTFPVRVSIDELRWARNTMRLPFARNGFEGVDGGVIDFENGIGTDEHMQVTCSFGEENENLDDTMTVDLSPSDWADLTALIEEMVEDWDEREARRVEMTASVDEWAYCIDRLRKGKAWEAEVIAAALEERGLAEDRDGEVEVTLGFYADEHDLDAIRGALKVIHTGTFPYWMKVASGAMAGGRTTVATEILNTLAWHDYGHNDTNVIEVAFSLEENVEIFPYLFL